MGGGHIFLNKLRLEGRKKRRLILKENPPPGGNWMRLSHGAFFQADNKFPDSWTLSMKNLQRTSSVFLQAGRSCS